MPIKITKAGEVAAASSKRAAEDSSEHPVAKKMSPGVPEKPAASDSGWRICRHVVFLSVIQTLSRFAHSN
jgi:hypothetical protein